MKIAIAGYAVEGKENYKYWAQDSSNEITIVDERAEVEDLPEGVPTILGSGSLQQLEGFDLVVRTASMAPYKIKTDGKIWSATNEFFAKCPAPIIGVTGTKGKGTTSTMIATILRETGKTVWLVGNIGVSAIQTLPKISPDDYVVFELSSFQLWDIERSPHVAVVLGIEPDHLNVHRDMEEYVNAKANIHVHQQDGDVCIYHYSNKHSLQIAQNNTVSRNLPYGAPSADDLTVFARNGSFCTNNEAICSVDVLQVPGIHNVENACAAISTALSLGVDRGLIEQGLRKFEGLPHRLEKVRELNGVTYYNDSFSSAPSATIAAVRAFTQPERLILGGFDKGGDYSEVVQELAKAHNIAAVYLIGQTRHVLAELLQTGAPHVPLVVCDQQTMQEIVQKVATDAQPGDIVLLSPGSASFDMFKDFYDRGEQFKSVVQQL